MNTSNIQRTSRSAVEETKEDQLELAIVQKGLEEVPPKLFDAPRNKLAALIDMSRNEITELPSMFFVYFTNLEILVLQNNKLIALHPDIPKLTQLRILKLDHNLLSTLPYSIGEMPSLECLSVSKNNLLTIPMSILGLAKTLKTLNLSSNAVRFLPPEIGSLTNLSELYLDHNRFTTIPCTLSSLKNLTELSLDWLCYTSYAMSHIKGESLKRALSSLHILSAKIIFEKRAELDCMEFIQHFSPEIFDINAQDITTNRSWLHMASRYNHLSVVETLLKMGAEVNVLDKERYTPLCLAIKHHNLEAATALLKANTGIDYGGGPFGTPLHMAVLKNELWLVKEILRRGANPNVADAEALNTSLHHLFSSFDRSSHKAAITAETLIAAGADPNLRNLEGWAPIHIAAKKGQLKAVKWAVSWNFRAKSEMKPLFDFNLIGGMQKWTALHLAGHAGHYKLVQVLIQAGADLFIRNSDLRTPRQSSKGNLAIYKMFKRAETLAVKTRISAVVSPDFPEQHDESDTRTAKSVVSPYRRERTTPIAEAFATEMGKREKYSAISSIGQSPLKPIFSSPFEPAEGVLKYNTARQYASVNVRPIGRSNYRNTINVYYLKDKILNNTTRLHERYEALNNLKNGRNAQSVKAFGEVLAKVLMITNQGLQLDIIHSANAMTFPGVIQTLEQLLHDCDNEKIKEKLVETLEEVKQTVVRNIKNAPPEMKNEMILSSSIKFPKNLLLSMQKERVQRYFHEEEF